MRTAQKYNLTPFGATMGVAALAPLQTSPALSEEEQANAKRVWSPSATTILHVKIWYDGKEGEFNLTGPNMIWGDFIEMQYFYLRQYFRKVGVWMKLEAYQAFICSPRPDGTVRAVGTYEKVVFLEKDGFANGSTCGCQKGGISHV